MTHPSRRRFIGRLVAASSVTVTAQGFGQIVPAHIDEADEQAVALGYRADTTQVEAKKYPNHNATQRCNNCSFWQGKPDDAWAGCAMFGRKQIANAGWCQVWAKAPG